MVWGNSEFLRGIYREKWVPYVLLVLNAVKTVRKMCKNELKWRWNNQPTSRKRVLEHIPPANLAWVKSH